MVKKTSKKIQNSKNLISSTLSERLTAAIAALGYRHTSQFIEDTGVNKSTMYAILSGKTKDPGSRILEKCYYAGINLNWLITGQEEMMMIPSATAHANSADIDTASKPYDTLDAANRLEEKIRDTMEDMLGMYQRLKKFQEYAVELEKLDPQQEKLFHNLVQTFLDSSKSRR